MFPGYLKSTVAVILVLIYCGLLSVASATAETLQPEQILLSDIVVQATHMGTMPFDSTRGTNLASPVVIKNRLYLVDQNDAIYRWGQQGFNQIFDVIDAPDGLLLDNRQSILNIAPGRGSHRIYVMFTSGNEPTTPIPIYRLPDPLPGECCDLNAPLLLADLYRIGPFPPPLGLNASTRTEYQVLYEYRLRRNQLTRPRAIAAFETQSRLGHNGGGLLTLPDGRLLFATGDALPYGTDGRSAVQDPAEHLGKILIIDPTDGAIEIAVQGVRNVQRLEFVTGRRGHIFGVAFADIGGVTAEEINFIELGPLLDSSVTENFGWGRNSDGLAREGTFYVQPGMPLVLDTEPPAAAAAPVPETGFYQPVAQYGRHDPNGGVAVSGPVTSRKSFNRLLAFFSDLSTGFAYGIIDPPNGAPVPVYRINLISENGLPLDSFNDLAGGRADPRFFRFPDGSAGVLLENTGAFYRLTETAADNE